MKALKAKYFWGIPANRWLKATYSKWKYSAVRGILVNISNVLFYIIHLNMERFNRNICGFCCLIVVLKWTAPPVTPQARQLSPSCDRLHCIHMVFSWVLLVNRHRFMCIYTQTHVERKKKLSVAWRQQEFCSSEKAKERMLLFLARIFFKRRCLISKLINWLKRRESASSDSPGFHWIGHYFSMLDWKGITQNITTHTKTKLMISAVLCFF